MPYSVVSDSRVPSQSRRGKGRGVRRLVGRGGWLHGREGELLTDLPPRGRVDQGALERHDHPRTADGVERLGEIRSRVPGLTHRLVAQRLRELEREGAVERAYTAATTR
ncbi:hypothetical protein CXG46_17390 [Nocardioides alpinus]|uniref:HTH hxlR-type domain-containing protein n=1 Tax=Nocardioides alpinus TaxID=748909 RepID=A0ABX4QRH4_9ACTN|nr:hypothetical protein CXG46_17390 [Nocardioides alpinus]